MTTSSTIPLPLPGSPITILLVEDDEDLGTVVAESLGSQGQRVTIATNAVDAEVLLHHPGLQVLVTDFSIPGGDGLSLIRRVRNDPQLAHLAVVLATGHPDADGLKQAAASLSAAFVAKPFDLDGLWAAIERARALLPPPTVRAA